MSALSISPPFPIFSETDGTPLEDGFIYIGAANQNPEVAPINVYWDAALVIPAAQPVRTLGGYPSQNGTPARLYVNADDFSITVKDKNSTLVYSALSDTTRIPFALVSGTLGSDRVIYAPTGGTVEEVLTNHGTRIGELEDQVEENTENIAENTTEIARFQALAMKSFNSVNGNLAASSFGGTRCVNILGDSISYGANAQNIQRDSWAGIFGRMLNLEFGTQNLGWLNVIASTSNAEGTYLNYHTQTAQTGTWLSITNADAGHIPSGYAIESSVATSTLVYRVPVTQRYMRVWYDGTVAGEIEVLINAVVVQTIVTTGAGTGWDKGGYLELGNLTATRNGICAYTIRCKSGTVRITGFEFTNDTSGFYRLMNFSRDGRAGRYVSQDVINKACEGCYFLVWALGVNDVAGGATAVAEYTQRIDWLIAAAAANKTRVILIDFVYEQLETNGIRAQIRRAADEIPGAVLIDVAKSWAPDGIELSVSGRTSRGLSVGVHPEEIGHRLVAEVVAQRIGLSVTSKRLATRGNPMWQAFDMSAGVAVNANNVPGQFVGWKLGTDGIHLAGLLGAVPGAPVSLGTIPPTEMPAGAIPAINFKSAPDAAGNTGQLSLTAGGALTYTPVGVAPTSVVFSHFIPWNDTATWN